MTKTPKKREQEAEDARRDLARMQQQTEKLLGPEDDSTGQGKDDFVEVWGQRIGRGLGIAFAIFLLVYLFRTYIF